MRRKFLSVVLCVCMILTMAPFAFAAGETGISETEIVTTNPPSSSSGSGSGSGVVTAGITTEDALKEAISNAATAENKIVTLDGDIDLTSQLTINTSITLNGNGHTIKANNASWSTDNSSKHLVSIEAGSNKVAFNDVVFDCSNQADNIQVYKSSDVTFNNITLQNSKSTYADMIVNASSVIVTGTLTASKSINVGWGNSISDVSSCSFNAENATLKGVVAVYTDSDDVTNAGNISKFTLKLPDGWVNTTSEQTPIQYLPAVAKVGNTSYASISAAVNASEKAGTVTLLKDSVEAITIPADKTITLDLNGHKIVNSSAPQNNTVADNLRKHTITNNGTLTIMDSVGTGVVDNVSHGRAALYNAGTISEIKGGTFTRSVDNSTDATSAKGNSYYVVENKEGATITAISAGDFLAVGKFSSLFRNGGTIGEISGGTFTQDGFISFKNEGTVNKISGGTFSSKDESCIQNWGTIGEICGGAITAGSIGIWNFSSDKYTSAGKVTNISGGEIKGTTAAIRLNDYDATYLKPAKPSSINRASATISGGKINGVLQVNTNTTLTITGGLFTTDPSAYCETGKTGISSGDNTYPYTVGEKKVNSEPATVDSATVPAKTTSNNNTVKEVASSISGATVENNNATEAATKDIANENKITADTNISTDSQEKKVSAALNEKVSDANKTTDANPVAIVYQTYVDVTVTDAKKSDTSGTTALSELSVELTPMYRVVATTKNVAESTTTEIKLAGNGVTDANAIQIGEPQKLNVPDQEYIIKLALPSNLDTAGGKLSIKHTKENGSIEYYTGIVSTEGEAPNTKTYVTFTTNGFSPFVISAPVASIGDDVYPSLQAAVDAVQNGQTIKLEKDCAETATVSRAVNFTLNKNSKDFTGAINAGSKYNLTKANGEGTAIIYTVTYVGGGSSSSGTPTTTYAVNVNAATNGTVAADKKTASKGTTVTVTASPSKGYVVDAVKVVDKDGKDVAVTEKDGKYVFTMPASAVTVTGSFKAETPAPVALPFTDVKSGNWFYDAVKYAYAQGLMTGTSATTFAPNGTMNRAMIVTVLYRLEKSPAVTGASKFTDVPAGQWYSDAVAWAAANKIVNGYDETTFGPMNAVTREQMAAILFRYEQVKGLENVTLEENLNRFPDQNKISAYAIPALQWAVGQKIINGNADGTLDPTGTATRAQVAQIFTNLLNK